MTDTITTHRKQLEEIDRLLDKVADAMATLPESRKIDLLFTDLLDVKKRMQSIKFVINKDGNIQMLGHGEAIAKATPRKPLHDFAPREECPICHQTKTVKLGRNRAGQTRWRCNKCWKNFVPDLLYKAS